jgi:hypothetical protein
MSLGHLKKKPLGALARPHIKNMGKKLSGNGLVVTNVRAAKKKHDEVLNTGLWGNASVLRTIQQSTYNKPRTDD